MALRAVPKLFYERRGRQKDAFLKTDRLINSTWFIRILVNNYDIVPLHLTSLSSDTVRRDW